MRKEACSANAVAAMQWIATFGVPCGGASSHWPFVDAVDGGAQVPLLTG